mmetsp:Transcript_51295/g.81740  ORF Transcript_51295/g.81740 Transcript_51295/m.81740 type:complete len:210 (+) Transcript_51295:336-965(+)
MTRPSLERHTIRHPESFHVLIIARESRKEPLWIVPMPGILRTGIMIICLWPTMHAASSGQHMTRSNQHAGTHGRIRSVGIRNRANILRGLTGVQHLHSCVLCQDAQSSSQCVCHQTRLILTATARTFVVSRQLLLQPAQLHRHVVELAIDSSARNIVVRHRRFVIWHIALVVIESRSIAREPWMATMRSHGAVHCAIGFVLYDVRDIGE